MTNNAEPILAPERKVSEAHPELHHYTDLRGLRGILTSQSLWCVQYNQMNDPTEFDYIKDLLNTAVAPKMQEYIRRKRISTPRVDRLVRQSGGIIPLVEHETAAWVGSLHEALTMGSGKSPKVMPHVTSFCAHTDEPYERENGLLSQWRAYGGAMSFAIVFETAVLEQMVQRELDTFAYYGAFFTSVVYDDDNFDITERFPNLVTGIFRAWTRMLETEDAGLAEIVEPLIKTAIRIKHRAFYEEREIRIVTLPRLRPTDPEPDDEAKRLPLKPHVQNPKPHVELFGPVLGELPIRRIIVGPSRRLQDAVEEARSLTGGRIDIVASKTPYIPKE